MQVAPLLAEIFQRRDAVSHLLNLVEEEQRLSRDNLAFVILLQLVEDSVDIEVGEQGFDKGIVVAIDI